MYARILIPVDGSETSKRGIAEAVRLAGAHSPAIGLVCIANDASMAVADAAYASDVIWQEVLADAEGVVKEARQLLGPLGATAQSLIVDGRTGTTGALIARQAADWRADIIVMGTHGRSGIGRALLGSTAEYILRHTSVPLLLVRHA